MGDGKHRALKMGDILFQPFRCLQIQMIGGLVKKKDIGILQDQPCEIDARFFAAGKIIKQTRAHILRDLQPIGNTVPLRIGFISAETLKFTLKPVVLFQQQFTFCTVFQLSFNFTHAAFRFLQSTLGGSEDIFRRPAFRINRDLGDQTNAFSGSNGHTAFIIVQFSGQNTEKAGFSCSVFPENGNAFTFCDSETEPVKNIAADFKTFYKIINTDVCHDCSFKYVWKISLIIRPAVHRP